MKKQFIAATLFMLILLLVMNQTWACPPAKEQKEQAEAVKKTEVTEKTIADNKVSYGTLPVFNFLLSATINAFKKASVHSESKKEEASLKPADSNQQEGAC